MANVNLEEMKKCKFWGNADDVFMMLYLIDHATAQEIYYFGETLPEGSVITSYRSIAKELHRSFDKVKEIISRLVGYGSLIIKSVGNSTIVTVSGYSELVANEEHSVSNSEQSVNKCEQSVSDSEHSVNNYEQSVNECEQGASHTLTPCASDSLEESERKEVTKKERKNQRNK